MKDIESFLQGYKPALLTNPHYQLYHAADLLKLSTYPSTKVKIHKMDQLLYFQTKAEKQRFLQQTHPLLPDSPCYHREVGLALGFPPKAVEYYVTTMHHESVDEQKVYLEYCGIGFVTSIDYMMEDIQWLWQHVPTRSKPFFTNVCYKVQGKQKPFHLKIAYSDSSALTSAYLTIKNTLEVSSVHI
ncbi:hypothetical protein [Laceyella putida]|jgi:hypothetical protein|uniref:Uncharacterized protein n=1 Tax=Laceyella putida TaxID=110101 RepID=A0ABW2RMJ7_9BACL